MQPVFAVIVPVAFVLALGVFLRARVLKSPEPWMGLEFTTYYVFTPALFMVSIGNADLSAVPLGPLAAAIAVPVLLVAGAAVVLSRALGFPGPAVAAMMQGSIRLNTYIGLAFAQAVYQVQGVAVFALACAVMVPLVNVLCVAAHSAWGSSPGTKHQPMWRELATNPLIVGCIAGVLLNVAPWRSEPLDAVLTMLGAPALACGTLAAGAAITLKVTRGDLAALPLVGVLKFAAMPAAAFGMGTWLGLPPTALFAVVLICSLPVAASSVILSSRLGGDVRLMASLNGFQTVASIATLPVTLWLTGV